MTLRKAIEAALPFVDKRFTDQPLIEARLRITMGLSFLYLGEAAIAAEQFQKARALYSEHHGPDHRDTLISMNNLALSYSALGRHTNALKLQEETLALQKANLGPDHPDTLGSMNNLADTYETPQLLEKNPSAGLDHRSPLNLPDPDDFGTSLAATRLFANTL